MHNDFSPNDPYSKTRNSKYTALKWVKLLSEDDIYIVQKACDEPMRLLGYNFMSNIHHDKKNKRFSIFSNNQMIIFVHSRRDTARTAKYLKETAFAKNQS